MNRVSGIWSARRSFAVLLAFVLVAGNAAAQSAACNRARAIVDEVKAQYAGGHPDHKAIITKLRTAQQLCPTLGDAWKYAYCSAIASGDEATARIFKDRALFNGVTGLDCGLAGPSAPVAPALPTYVRQKYALVVGIGTFQDKTIRELQFAAKDAQDFATVLKEQGNFRPENVWLLTDKAATRDAILNKVQDIFLLAREDDLVVVYISSHGSAAEKSQGLDGISYIVTYDTDPKKKFLRALDYQEFAKQVSLIRARRKVTFLDTCYSGESAAGGKDLVVEGGVDDRTAQRFLSGEGSFVIMSSDKKERSWESDSIRNSYFTHYIVEFLRRSKEPPSIKELFAYVSTKVPDAVAREKQQPQHPQMLPADGPADVRIGVIPRAQSGTP
jgi:hypothetical protein